MRGEGTFWAGKQKTAGGGLGGSLAVPREGKGLAAGGINLCASVFAFVFVTGEVVGAGAGDDPGGMEWLGLASGVVV